MWGGEGEGGESVFRCFWRVFLRDDSCMWGQWKKGGGVIEFGVGQSEVEVGYGFAFGTHLTASRRASLAVMLDNSRTAASMPEQPG